MKKEIKALHNRIDDTKGFTTRSDKKNTIGRGGHGDGNRFVATPLPEHGNFPQHFRGKPWKKVAFHKPTGRLRSFRCAGTLPMLRYGGEALASGLPERRSTWACWRAQLRRYYGQRARRLRHAVPDRHGEQRPHSIRRRRLLHYGRQTAELYDTVSAFSFAVAEERVPDTIDEYLECCQPAATRFGVCAVGGAMHINNFGVHDKVHADALVMPPPPAPPTAPQSVVSNEEMYPVSALHAHEPRVSFMDKFAVNLDLTGPEPTLAMHCMGPVAPVDSVSLVAAEDSDDDDEGLPPPRQALGCGRPPMGFGFSALTSLAVCVLFLVCAAAVPTPNHSTHESSATPEHIDDEVGSAGVLSPTAVPPALYWRAEGWYPNDHGDFYIGSLWTWYPGPSQPG
ncbi:hypothetical protein CYMTET_53362 [Cymbomonas tetramitiformis]|uniref:Uncharacterized protein n=1 Tax=Cymbomonas tetramitiformis TaxID=36881 RepID=A0AAE0BI81_9CHLO|nr:hypothetical protein CYMTET_53362 [Cymbomonas tetramitiformis]